MRSTAIPINPEKERPAIGLWDRIILGGTPVPTLIRNILRSKDSKYRFIEDHRIPLNLIETLERKGLSLLPGGDFFLFDRHPLRAGLIVCGPAGADSLSREEEIELIELISRWLGASRKKDSFALFPVTGPRAERFELKIRKPAILAVWTSEGTLLERLGEKSGVLPGILRIQPQVKIQGKRFTEEQTSSSATPPEKEPWKSWNLLRYAIVGNTRGAPRRKMLMKQEAKSLKIAMISSPAEISNEYALSFFDAVMFESPAPRLHRRLLEGFRPESISSWSIELDQKMNFDSFGSGFSPILWSGRKKSVTLFPGNSIDVVHGRLGRGDMMLAIPSGFTGSEIQELDGILRNQDARQIPEKIGTWLDFRCRGRGLLLGRD